MGGGRVKQYLVEVKYVITATVLIDASNTQNAIKRVLRHEGTPKDDAFGKPEVVAVRRLDE